jgi:hypothetical protein
LLHNKLELVSAEGEGRRQFLTLQEPQLLGGDKMTLVEHWGTQAKNNKLKN